MPIFDDITTQFDADAVSRDVLTVGLKLANEKHETVTHRHRKAQCMMAISGVLTCEAEGGIWIVPPQTAMWIPPDVDHRVTFSGNIEGYNAFIESAAIRNLPARCCSLTVSRLLCELLIRSAQWPAEVVVGRSQTLVSALLLEEIFDAPFGNLHVPMPKDERLRTVFQAIMTTPSIRRKTEDWAKELAMSERSFSRFVVAETGMSFGRWRQQLNIVLSIQWMAKGAGLQQVAGGLGYESVGSFVTMFGKTMGSPPGRYMAAWSG